MKAMPERLAHEAYSLLLRLLQPAYRVRLWWRGRSEPTYREVIGERFGAYGAGDEAPAGSGWIWVHAVSLGETRAAAALIDALRAARPDMRLLLTHGTATGREAGTELLHAGDRQVWQPYDTPQAVARFFARFRPAIGVLMETEVWPNLLRGAQLNAVPMVLANARLSERSQRKGERMEALLRPAVASLALALAQTEDDAQRLRAAGARDVVVAGNLKFDMTPDDALLARGALWRRGLGRDVLLAAVTREGEEALLLAAWARLGGPEPGRPLLLIVPRHPPRFDEVAAQVQAAGLTLARRSAWGDSPPPEALAADVWLGDSMREMALYYAFAQVALLGGSFAPLGGQNLIEAAACGCPIVMGPHTFNFADAAELALAAGAALRASDIDVALQEALALLAAPVRLAQRSRAAQQFAATHRGAAQRMAQRIAALLPAS
jgi:3-deoxy-D-manno-octulosonic-acid transferase